MSKLSDSQLVVLSAACQRADRNVLPLPAKLKGGAAGKVVNSLLAKGLIKKSAPSAMSRSGAPTTTAAASPCARPAPPSTRSVLIRPMPGRMARLSRPARERIPK